MTALSGALEAVFCFGLNMVFYQVGPKPSLRLVESSVAFGKRANRIQWVEEGSPNGLKMGQHWTPKWGVQHPHFWARDKSPLGGYSLRAQKWGFSTPIFGSLGSAVTDLYFGVWWWYTGRGIRGILVLLAPKRRPS